MRSRDTAHLNSGEINLQWVSRLAKQAFRSDLVALLAKIASTDVGCLPVHEPQTTLSLFCRAQTLKALFRDISIDQLLHSYLLLLRRDGFVPPLRSGRGLASRPR